MTADHTPERLSADFAWMMDYDKSAPVNKQEFDDPSIGNCPGCGNVRWHAKKCPWLADRRQSRQPERLSAGERRALHNALAFHTQPGLARIQAVDDVAPAVERILGAHLADMKARLAASDRALAVQQETTRRVERLRAEAEARLAATWQKGHDAACPQGEVCSAHQPPYRAALHPDPTESVPIHHHHGEPCTSKRCPNAGMSFPDPSEAARDE